MIFSELDALYLPARSGAGGQGDLHFVPPESRLTHSSERAIGNYKGGNRNNQYFCVECHRPITCIKRVTCNALVVRGFAAAADLPQPGDTGSARQVFAYGTRVTLQLFVGHGTSAHDAHV